MRLVLPVILAAITPVALAERSATLDITNLRFEVTDLRPDDGIAPSHHFLGFYALGMSVLVTKQHTRDELVRSDTFYEPYGSWAFELNEPYASANTEITWTADQFRVLVQGVASDATPDRGMFRSHSIADYYGEVGAFTSVKVTADYVIDLHADPMPQASRQDFVDVHVSGHGYAPLHARAYSNPAFGSTDVRREGQLTFSHINDSQTPWRYDNTFFMHAWGVAPIPEPASFALLLAGLGVVGGVAHRRKAGPA